MSRNITVTTILMLLTGVQAQPSVTLSSQSLCVVIGSTVNIPCTFTPGHSGVTQRQWYRVQSPEGEPQDLRKDPEYSGRVSVNTWGSDCSLTVSNVRVSDSGVYYFRFKTQSSDWISASSGVQLNVTDLQVKVKHHAVGQKEVTVTCSYTCSLRTLQIFWYKRRSPLINRNGESIVLDLTSSSDYGYFSCQVYESKRRSPPVCVLGKQCWGVTYTAKRVCVLKNTSVDLSCAYKYPAGHTVIKSVWFFKKQVYVEPEDVREDKEYQGRVQYTQISQNDCSLRITNLRERDAQTYRFRFYTDDPTGKYTGEPGVSLSVTDLQVRLSHYAVASEEQTTVTLGCITSCTLPNSPIYMWYKNGQPVISKLTKHNKLYLISSEDAGNYSCAVKGSEDLRSPEQIVTLTVAPVLKVFSSNEGSEAEMWKLHAVWGAAAALVPALLLSLLTAVLCVKRKKRAERDIQCVPQPGDDTYTELNLMTMSPDYDTLQNIQSSSSDTYTTLNPATMSSDYDVLRCSPGFLNSLEVHFL
ncbi:sialoadhesin-like [Tachysurus ichikawai]